MQSSLLSPFKCREGALSALEMKGACLEKDWPFTISKAQVLGVFFSHGGTQVLEIGWFVSRCWKCREGMGERGSICQSETLEGK